MISAFAYWSDEDLSPVVRTMEQWSAAFPDFRILGDRDVLPILEDIAPDFVESYLRMRVPAAKSDVARLAWLHRYGGLYLDCHFGLTDLEAARQLPAALAEVEQVAVVRGEAFSPPRRYYPKVLINGFMLARPGTPHLLGVLRQAIADLDRQRERERQQGWVPYNCWRLCGPGLLTRMSLTEDGRGGRLLPDLEGQVRLIREEELPAERNVNRPRHGRPHWSEMEKTERLFEP